MPARCLPRGPPPAAPHPVPRRGRFLHLARRNLRNQRRLNLTGTVKSRPRPSGGRGNGEARRTIATASWSKALMPDGCASSTDVTRPNASNSEGHCSGSLRSGRARSRRILLVALEMGRDQAVVIGGNVRTAAADTAGGVAGHCCNVLLLDMLPRFRRHRFWGRLLRCHRNLLRHDGRNARIPRS